MIKVIAALFLCFFTARLATAKQLDANEAVTILTRAFSGNYSAAGIIQGKTIYRREDSPEARESIQQLLIRQQMQGKEDAEKHEDKPLAASLEEQYKTRTQEFLLGKDAVRFNGSLYDPGIIITISGDRHTLYDSSHRMATIRGRIFESYDYRDPREIFRDGSLRTVQLIQSCSVASADLSASKDGPSVLTMRLVDPAGKRMYLECDSSVDFLPVLWIQFQSDLDELEYSGELEYQQIRSDQGMECRFPKLLEVKFWGGKPTLFTPMMNLSSGWRQKHTYQYVDVTMDGSKTATDIALDLPDGTTVYDLIAYSRRVQGMESSHIAGTSLWRSRYMTFLIATIVTILLVLVVRKRAMNFRSGAS